MSNIDVGTVTAYGMAKNGGYTGTCEEWYNLLFVIASGVAAAPYDAMSERPRINGITISGNKTLSDYDVYDRCGGSYFRITGNVGDDIEINGVHRGTLDSTGMALIGGVMEVGTTEVKIGSITHNIDTPYFGLYRVTK